MLIAALNPSAAMNRSLFASTAVFIGSVRMAGSITQSEPRGGGLFIIFAGVVQLDWQPERAGIHLPHRREKPVGGQDRVMPRSFDRDLGYQKLGLGVENFHDRPFAAE